MEGKNPKKTPEEKKAMKAAMKGLSSFIFYMIADFALIAGIVLILFGLGEYISSVVGIPGVGKVGLGIILFVIGVAVLSRAKARIQVGVQPPMQPPMGAPPPSPPPPTGTYR